MKKIISTIIASVLFVSCAAITLPHSSFAESSPKGDFMYNEHEQITSYAGDNGTCEIPENTVVNSLKGNPITKLIVNKGVKLSTLPISAQTTLKEVEFKDGVTEVDYSYFEGCKSLEKVTLPSTLHSIGDNAFMNCKNLKTINWTDSLQSIGEYAFYGAKSLSGNIIMPDTVTYIGKNAFAECGDLNKVHLSDNISNTPSDGQNWFAGTNVKEINIPDSLLDNPPELRADEIIFNSDMTVKIYNAVRDSNWCFNEYHKGKTDKTIGQYDGFAIVEDTVLRYIGTDKNPIVPEGVKIIGNSAFLYCDVDTVSLPKSLETISDSAFRMSTLKNITIPQDVKYIGSNAFENCPLLESVTVKGNPELGDTAFRITAALTEHKLVFEKNSQSLMEKVIKSGISEECLPTFYEQLNENRERVGFKTVKVPTKAEIQPTATPQPTETPNPAVNPTSEPIVSPMPEALTVSGGKEIKISIDGKAVEFDAKPFVDSNNRTLVPIRAVSEMLNAKVDWDGQTQTVTISQNGKIVKIVIGSDTITVDEKTVEMDTKAIILEERTYIPIRFVAETLGLTVEWVE